ncbi:MAG: M1 aminopeptidase family protein [Planctomycetota bacterium]|jgi:hypothetical protein
MSLLVLLLLESWPVTYAQGLLDQLHSYDIERIEVVARPDERGVGVDCRLTVKPTRPGPLRFFLSSGVEGLEVERGGEAVKATLDADGLAQLLALVGRHVEGVPQLLTLPGAAVGRTTTFRLRYRWRPSGRGLGYASGGAVQTHLSSFWLPSMADELFTAKLTVESDRPYVATRSERARQVLCLVAGDFAVHRRGQFAVYVPTGVEADADRLLDDLALVLKTLTESFGERVEGEFRLVVEPRRRPSPSYCDGTFAVVHQAWLGADRARWIAHLAHECSHVWWGHGLATPVVGRGGTFLREGLAEWSGIRVAGRILGKETERALWRDRVRGYFRQIDLRREEGRPGVVFANEPTLLDATYVDPPAVAYRRGALVLRIFEHRDPDGFRDALRTMLKAYAGKRVVGLKEFGAALGETALLDYYARTSRLPDFAIDGDRVVCLDPAFPKVRIQALVDGKLQFIEVPGTLPAGKIELDPERIYLDPVRSNSRR